MVLEEIIAEDAQRASPQYRVARLPNSFCWIFDNCENVVTTEVFIEQLQASREKSQKNSPFRPMKSRLRRRRDRTAEIENILFSTFD